MAENFEGDDTRGEPILTRRAFMRSGTVAVGTALAPAVALAAGEAMRTIDSPPETFERLVEIARRCGPEFGESATLR
jgi:hypothetical protein